MSDSQTWAAASKPWSFSITSSTPPSPWSCRPGSTHCHRSRNLTKSAGVTGLISRRSRPMVARCIRARIRRSQNSSPRGPERNCPRSITPSFSNRARAILTSESDRPSVSRISSAVNGPEHSTQPRSNLYTASSLSISSGWAKPLLGEGSIFDSG